MPSQMLESCSQGPSLSRYRGVTLPESAIDGEATGRFPEHGAEMARLLQFDCYPLVSIALARNIGIVD